MASRFHLILALALKDWWLFLSDRRAAALCFVVPVVLASAFGVIFHKAPGGGSAPRLQLLVVADDAGPFTRRVVDDLLASPRVDAEVVTRAEAEARVGDRRPGVAVVFPAGFGAGRLEARDRRCEADRPRPAQPARRERGAMGRGGRL